MSDYFGLNKAEKKEPAEEKKEEKKENKEENEKKKKEEDDKKKNEENKNEEEEGLKDKSGKEEKIDRIVDERIEFDMSQTKKQIRMKKEDKAQMELIRRWQVKIYNIYITPLKDRIEPFIQFTIGGDYSIQVFSTKSGDSYKVPKGERGFAEKTEVLETVEPLNKAPFDKIIDIEMRMLRS